MAQNKGFGLDFNGFLDLAEDISNISNELLLETATKALEASRDLVNIEIGKAMKNSKFSFKKGEKYSQGNARESLKEIDKRPVEVSGTTVTAYAGVDLSQAPEVLILAVHGTPNEAKDAKLYQAIAVKGKVRTQVNELQEAIFNEALKEALNQ